MEFRICDLIAKFKEGSLKGVDIRLIKYIENHIADSSKVKKDGKLSENELQAFLNEIDADKSGTISETELDKFLGNNKKGQEIKESIKSVLTTNEVPMQADKVSALEGKPGVKREGDDGQYYVNVQKTGSAALEGNRKANSNLWNMWTNYFKGEVDWPTFKEEVMKSNPQIYGEDVKRGSRTGTVVERWIYDGEKLYLPGHLLGNVDKPQESQEPQEPQVPQEPQEDKGVQSVEKGEDGGKVVVMRYKDKTTLRVYEDDCNRVFKTEKLDADGRQIGETTFYEDGKTMKQRTYTAYNDDGSRGITILDYDEDGNEIGVTVRKIDANGIIQYEEVDGEYTIEDGESDCDYALTDEQKEQIGRDMQQVFDNMVSLTIKMTSIRRNLATASSKTDFERLMNSANSLVGSAYEFRYDWSQYGNSQELNSYIETMNSYTNQLQMRLREAENLRSEIEASQKQAQGLGKN